MNKQYKHKTTGHIAKQTNSGKNYKVSYPQNYTIPTWIIENSNDWEEIPIDYKELSLEDWLIEVKKLNLTEEELVTFIGTCHFDNHYSKLEGEWSRDKAEILYNMWNPKEEVYNIGDYVIAACDDTKGYLVKLTSVNPIRGEYTIPSRVSNRKPLSSDLGTFDHIQRKALPEELPLDPLFTTEDGVEIFDLNTSVAWVIDGKYEYNLRLCKEHLEGSLKDTKSYKIFSNKEKAIEYETRNKPCLSINDVATIIEQCNKTTLDKLTENLLTNFVKSKL